MNLSFTFFFSLQSSLSFFFCSLLYSSTPTSIIFASQLFLSFFARLSHGCVMDSWTRHFLFSCVRFAYIYVHKLGMLLRCLLRNYHLNFSFAFFHLSFMQTTEMDIYKSLILFLLFINPLPVFCPHMQSFLIPHTSSTFLYLFHSLFCSVTFQP